MLCERAGVVNIAIEGMMLTGAFTAVAASNKLGNPWLGMFAAILAGMLLGRPGPTVLTPHAGELKRLTGTEPDWHACAALAKASGAVVLLKCNPTFVCSSGPPSVVVSMSRVRVRGVARFSAQRTPIWVPGRPFFICRAFRLMSRDPAASSSSWT